VMVVQTHRYDGESGGDVLVFYADEVIAVLLFAAEGQIRGTAPNTGRRTIEIRDDEFMMDSVAGQRSFGLERRWKLAFGLLGVDQQAVFAAGFIERNVTARIVRDAVCIDRIVLVQVAERPDERSGARVAHFHHRKKHRFYRRFLDKGRYLIEDFGSARVVVR